MGGGGPLLIQIDFHSDWFLKTGGAVVVYIFYGASFYEFFFVCWGWEKMAQGIDLILEFF